LAVVGDRTSDIETASVISSTFSLGEPVATNEEIDSEAEEEFSEVVEGIKKTNLKDIPNATRRPSRPHHSADIEEDNESITASSVSAVGDISKEKAVKRCLFCNFDSPSVELNAAHMERIHGMFIPERTYLVDLEGLIASLFLTIHEDHECLYCHKLKPSIFGLQTHMRDKGHCKIPFGTEDEQLEIGEFYDFTSTYSDIEDEDEDEDDDEGNLSGKKSSGGVKLGTKRPTKVANEDGDESMGDGDGWETDSSESSLDSDDLTAVPIDQRHQYEKLDKHPHHSSTDPRPHRNKDGFHSHAHKHAHAVFYSDYELHLPSGRTAGHRSLNKYFKQNLHNHPSPAERQEQLAIEEAASSDDEAEQQIARTNGERGRAVANRTDLGMVGVSAEKRKEVQAIVKRARKAQDRESRRYQWGVNKQNNSQKHFRVSLHYPFIVDEFSLICHRILCCSELWICYIRYFFFYFGA
jgi:pre-60S factor REI1